MILVTAGRARELADKVNSESCYDCDDDDEFLFTMIDILQAACEGGILMTYYYATEDIADRVAARLTAYGYKVAKHTKPVDDHFREISLTIRW